MAVMEVVLKAVDRVSDTVQGIGKQTGKTAGFMEQNWKAIGVGAAVAGGAFEMAARKQAPLTEQTQKLGDALNMTEGEVRDLASGMSDVTFPIEDVLDLMEKGRSQGIESAEQLEEYAQFWDMVGDATGESAVQLADGAAGLRAVGIAAGDEAEAVDAFGYITQETSGDVSDLLNFLERTGPEMREMGADVDDAAAIMGALEHELGMTARTARQEFRKAVQEADGDMDVMLETLGLTEEQFEEYNKAVGESSDVIERNAETHADSYTSMEKLQHKAEDLMYQYGDLIGMVGNFAPVMMALGPIIKGVSMAKKAMAAVSMKALVPAVLGATKAAWGFTAALLANPIVWIVALIVGLIAAIYLLWKNWDDVSEWLVDSWEKISETATRIWEGLAEYFSGFWERVQEFFGKALEFIKNLFFKYHPLGIIVAHWEEILDFFRNVWSRILGVADMSLDEIVAFFAQLPGRIWEWLVNVMGRIYNWDQEMINAAVEAGQGFINNVIDFFSRLPGRIWGFLTNVIGRVLEWRARMISRAREAGSRLVSGFMDMIRGLPGQLWGVLQRAVRNLFNIGSSLWNAAKSAGSRIWGGIKSGLGIGSPSYVEHAIDAMAERAKDLPGEMQAAFGRIPGLQPELEMGVNGAAATEPIRGAGTRRSELTIKHDLQDVPDHIDEERLAEILARSFERPEIQRALDQSEHDAKHRFKAQGREF